MDEAKETTANSRAQDSTERSPQKPAPEATLNTSQQAELRDAPTLQANAPSRTPQKPNRRARRENLPDSRQPSSKADSAAPANSNRPKPLNFAPQPVAKTSRPISKATQAARESQTRPAAVSTNAPVKAVVLTEDDLAAMTPEQLMQLKQAAERKKLERESQTNAHASSPAVDAAAEARKVAKQASNQLRKEKRKAAAKERKDAARVQSSSTGAEPKKATPASSPAASPKTAKYKLVEPTTSAPVSQSPFQSAANSFPDIPVAETSPALNFESTTGSGEMFPVPAAQILPAQSAMPTMRDSRPQASRAPRAVNGSASNRGNVVPAQSNALPLNGDLPARPLPQQDDPRARRPRHETRTSQQNGRMGNTHSSRYPNFPCSAERGPHGRFVVSEAQLVIARTRMGGQPLDVPVSASVSRAVGNSSAETEASPSNLSGSNLGNSSTGSPDRAARPADFNPLANGPANGRSTTGQAKAFFDAYIDKESALAGVTSGKYHRGVLRIPQKARKDAWVAITTKTINDDFLIEGDRARNRALSGDEVIIEVLESQDGKKNANGQNSNEGRVRARVVHIIASRPLARIAGIIRPPGWDISSPIQDDRTIIANHSNAKWFNFQPQDNRIPFLQLRQQDLPAALAGPNWVFNILQKQKTLFAARIDSWSEYSRFPKGSIVSELGTVGNIEAETAAILTDCDVDTRDHPPTAMACLPATPWAISPEEIARRRDFRKDRVCTIDPETARDLDDALSVRELGNGHYEIGVHIADVSHFVKQDSALDLVARDRATTVYMVQRAIPMLPRLLCEELCSLNPAVDRLAFSVTWTMDADGNEVGPRWYGRSVIRSAVRFAYGEAQNLLDGKSWADGVGKPVDGGHTEEQITQDVKTLLRMSKAMRAKRFDNGALTINAFKLNFRLNKDGIPGMAEVYELKDANRLIEEFMLKANISVAEKIVDAFPEHALLRMHPPPKDRPLQEFVNYAKRLGIDIDASTSATLQEGFVKLGALAKTNPVVAVLQNTAVRSMRRAEYICTGLHEDSDTWSHYALAVPLYTHFTSPIRRYADVVVHRLLDRALQITSSDTSAPEQAVTEAVAGFLPEACEAWAKNCNVRKDNARAAQERSSMLYLCAFIEETCKRENKLGMDEGYNVDAIVVSVKDRSIDIIVPSMALEKRIYYDKAAAIGGFVHDEENESTTVTWRTQAGRLAVLKAREETEDGPRLPAREDEQAVLLAPAVVEAPVEDETENATMQNGVAALSLDDKADKPAVTRESEFELSNVSTTLKAMSKVVVWLRGSFDKSPCEIDAGLVLPSGV